MAAKPIYTNLNAMFTMKTTLMFFSCFLCLLGSKLTAQDLDGQERNLSPYFHIQTEGISADQFPLLRTDVQVDIAGWVADVTVRQTYKNSGQVPIEAVYIFPASTRAAVYHMDMQVGSRKIVAEIQEKQEARRNYEVAKAEGKRTSLLEQERPNVFQMQVANILPGDEIVVTMKYNEFLISEAQMYQFVYPTVVGPRFVDHGESAEAAGFASNPFLNEGSTTPSQINIEVQLLMGQPVQDVRCHTHQTKLKWISEQQFFVVLTEAEKFGGNRDFILEYRLTGSSIDEGTLLYDHGDEKFFLTTIQPPAKVMSEDILPREYIFVVDISGSMSGFPLETSKQLLRNLIGALRPQDKFNIILFAGASEIFSPNSLPAKEIHISQAISFLDNQRGGGGTTLLPALQRAFAYPREFEQLSRSIIIVTDGYVTVEPQVFELIAQNLNRENVFAFGIGTGVNRHLIEGMAHVGRGEPFIVTKPEFAMTTAEKFRNYVQHPVLSNIRFEFEDFDAYDIVPLQTPDLFAERPVFIFGKYRGQTDGIIKVTGQGAKGAFQKSINLSRSQPDPSNSALRYLWAREQVRWLDDFNSLSQTIERVDQITQLGLQYNLLTDYTSFVAIDESPALVDGELTTVKQPLPLPQGVSNHAVGFEMGAEGCNVANHHAPPSPTWMVAVQGLSLKDRNVLEKALESFLSECSLEITLGNEELKIEITRDSVHRWQIGEGSYARLQKAILRIVDGIPLDNIDHFTIHIIAL